MVALYPLKFQPIIKDKIWGGQKLHQILGKPTNSKQAGESWEISDVDDNSSIVSFGDLEGLSLKTLLEVYQSELVGDHNYAQFGNKFPLLIKFIDAKTDLSVQLHPDDRLAKTRHNSFGKTEMWYVIQADSKANLIVGFNRPITKKVYLQHLQEKRLASILNFEQVSEGDTYFIDAGRIHAIGAGVLLAEIQQTSDITYRVHDWDRKDEKGQERELHNDLALEAIDFEMPDNFRVNYQTQKNTPTELVSCPYFSTHIITLDGCINKHNTHDSFVIYICIAGTVILEHEGINTTLGLGETVLIPACINLYSLSGTKAKLLEVYV
jgi:mannose-6-phosphate isomerase